MASFSFTEFGAHGNFINGVEGASVSGGTCISTCTANGKQLGTFANSGPADVDAAVSAAKAAQVAWARRPVGERSLMLLRCADAIEASAPGLARVLMWDSSSMKGKAFAEVMKSAALFRTAAGEAKRLYGDTFPNDNPDRMSLVIREPLGIVAVISPFNAPLVLCVKSLAFALGAGNAVIQKPSPETPLVTVHLARVLHSAGLPAGLFNVVTGDTNELGESMCSHPGVHSIGFTGSTGVGIRVGQSAAVTMKRTHLELGGKNPLIVCADIAHPDAELNMDKAVHQAILGAFTHSGQICMSSSRIIVMRPIADEFFAKLAAAANKLKLGTQLDDPSRECAQSELLLIVT